VLRRTFSAIFLLLIFYIGKIPSERKKGANLGIIFHLARKEKLVLDWLDGIMVIAPGTGA
jgi:hypothetical protein